MLPEELQSFQWTCIKCGLRNTSGVSDPPSGDRRRVRLKLLCNCQRWHEAVVDIGGGETPTVLRVKTSRQP